MFPESAKVVAQFSAFGREENGFVCGLRPSDVSTSAELMKDVCVGAALITSLGVSGKPITWN